MVKFVPYFYQLFNVICYPRETTATLSYLTRYIRDCKCPVQHLYLLSISTTPKKVIWFMRLQCHYPCIKNTLKMLNSSYTALITILLAME